MMEKWPDHILDGASPKSALVGVVGILCKHSLMIEEALFAEADPTETIPVLYTWDSETRTANSLGVEAGIAMQFRCHNDRASLREIADMLDGILSEPDRETAVLLKYPAGSDSLGIEIEGLGPRPSGHGESIWVTRFRFRWRIV